MKNVTTVTIYQLAAALNCTERNVRDREWSQRDDDGIYLVEADVGVRTVEAPHHAHRAAPRTADNAENLAAIDCQVEIFVHDLVAEGIPQPPHLDDRLAGHLRVHTHDSRHL